MRATLSALLLAAAASTATAHGHEGHAKAHQEAGSASQQPVSTTTGLPTAELHDLAMFEFVPDVSQYPANCLFASTLKAPNGQPVQLYDNTCQGVVDLHFKWMQQYGIDGIVVQRFLSHLDDTSFITVLNQVEAAAVKYGRGFMVEYDASGGNSATGSVAAQILADYNSKVKPYTTSSAYIHHNGKPAVMVFGVGYTTVAINVTDGANIATQLKGAGAYVGYGVPPTFGTDLRANTGFAAAYKAANLISPWTVGSFSEGGYLKGYHTTTQIPDSHFDYFPRYNGSFYSMQADAITSLAIKPLFAFNAMFDEINEGTQSLPCLKNNQLPTNEKFVGYDNTFADTAFYLELGGQKGAAFAAAVN
ncbi:hypothetical protein TrVFT333_002213 [Trichoderma virens FT-333]|nr:hypothetical protein TrVFT333_002213 [Trichoderma virens FT-333]